MMIAIGSMFYTVFISVVANFFSTLDRVNTLYVHYDISIDYFRTQFNVPNNLAYELRNFYKVHLKGNCLLLFSYRKGAKKDS